MINATKKLREVAPSKMVNDWLRLSSTKARIESICRTDGIDYQQAVCVVQGGVPSKQGTWIHEALEPLIVEWATSPSYRQAVRDEKVFGDFLLRVLEGIVEVTPQYRAGNFFVDFYIPEHKIAIEYDEDHHAYKKAQDALREAEITAALECRFVRIRRGEEAKGINTILHLVLP